MLPGQVTPAQVAVGPVPGRLIRVVKVPVAPPGGAVPNVPLNKGAASPAGVAIKSKTRKNAPQPRRVRMLVIVRLFIMMVVGRLLKSSIDFELLGNSKPSICHVGRDGALPSFSGNCEAKLSKTSNFFRKRPRIHRNDKVIWTSAMTRETFIIATLLCSTAAAEPLPVTFLQQNKSVRHHDAIFKKKLVDQASLGLWHRCRSSLATPARQPSDVGTLILIDAVWSGKF
jgi:hypothetical protein